MIESLFATKIYRTRYENFKEIASICNAEYISSLPAKEYIRSINTNLTVTTYGSWSDNLQNSMPHRLDPFSDLVKFIETHAKIYWDELGYFSDLTPTISDSWLQYYKKSGFIGTHNHNSNRISAILYIDVEPGQGNLVLNNPNDLIMVFCPLRRDGPQILCEIEVNPGDVIMFPGFLKHSSTPNNSDKERIIFVANLNELKNYE